MTTIDAYIQRELGDEEYVREDPDYQMTSRPPLPLLGHTSEDSDLEKGGASRSEITSTDCGFQMDANGCDDDCRDATLNGIRSSQEK